MGDVRRRQVCAACVCVCFCQKGWSEYGMLLQSTESCTGLLPPCATSCPTPCPGSPQLQRFLSCVFVLDLPPGSRSRSSPRMRRAPLARPWTSRKLPGSCRSRRPTRQRQAPRAAALVVSEAPGPRRLAAWEVQVCGVWGRVTHVPVCRFNGKCMCVPVYVGMCYRMYVVACMYSDMTTSSQEHAPTSPRSSLHQFSMQH